MAKNDVFHVGRLKVSKSNQRKGFWYKDSEGNTGYVSSFLGRILRYFS